MPYPTLMQYLVQLIISHLITICVSEWVAGEQYCVSVESKDYESNRLGLALRNCIVYDTEKSTQPLQDSVLLFTKLSVTVVSLKESMYCMLCT